MPTPTSAPIVINPPDSWRTDPWWSCPGCGHDVSLDGESEASAAADPLCCFCRPEDDARLTAHARRLRAKRRPQQFSLTVGGAS